MLANDRQQVGQLALEVSQGYPDAGLGFNRVVGTTSILL
jgi:hypothetical protein